MQRELKSGMYLPTPNWLAVVIIPILPNFIASWFLSLTIYFLVGFTLSVEQFFYFEFILFFAFMSGYYLAFLLAAIIKNPNISILAFSLMITFSNVFAGFLIRINTLPDFWIFGPYCSITRYAFEGLMINYFKGFGDEGESVLSYFSFGYVNKGFLFLILIAFAVFNIITSRFFMVAEANRIVKINDASNPCAKEDAYNNNDNNNDNTLNEQVFERVEEEQSIKMYNNNISIRSMYSNISDLSVKSITSQSDRSSYYYNSKRFKNCIYKYYFYHYYSSTSRKQEEYEQQPEVPKRMITIEDLSIKSSQYIKQQAKGCLLAFKDLTYSIPNRKAKNSSTVILDRVSGLVKPGK